MGKNILILKLLIYPQTMELQKQLFDIPDCEKNQNNTNFTFQLGIVLLHLPICVLGNLQWEIPGAYEESPRKILGGKEMQKSSIGLKSLLFFFDSLLRVISSMFYIKKNIFTELSIYTHWKIFVVRTIGALG